MFFLSKSIDPLLLNLVTLHEVLALGVWPWETLKVAICCHGNSHAWYAFEFLLSNSSAKQMPTGTIIKRI